MRTSGPAWRARGAWLVAGIVALGLFWRVQSPGSGQIDVPAAGDDGRSELPMAVTSAGPSSGLRLEGEAARRDVEEDAPPPVVSRESPRETQALTLLARRSDGTPEAFAEFRVLRQRPDSVETVVEVGRGDRLGRYTTSAASCPPGTRVVAEAAGFGSSGLVTIGVLAEPSEPVLLTVVPWVTVRGSVNDALGKPAAFVPVEVTLAGSLVGAAVPRAPQASTTDANGMFAIELDGVGGAFRLLAGAPPADSVARLFELRPGESAQLALQLASSMSVRGRVLSPDGAPAAGAIVSLGRLSVADAQGSGWAFLAARTCDGDGEFEWLAQEAMSVALFASAPGLASSPETLLELSPAEPPRFTLLQLREPASIAGRILWSNGEPISNAEIAALPVPDSDSSNDRRRALRLHGLARGRSDADGRFRLGPVTPGVTYSLSTAPAPESPECVARFARVEAGAEAVSWVVDSSSLCGSTLRARVVLEDTNQPPPSLLVELHRRRGQEWELVSQSSHSRTDGSFELRGLEPEISYALAVANQPGYLPIVWGPFRATDTGDMLALTMLRPRTVRAAVRAAQDALQPSTHVVCIPSDDLPGRAGFLAYPVDRQGQWAMYLWPGRYELRWVVGAETLALGELHVSERPLEQTFEPQHAK